MKRNPELERKILLAVEEQDWPAENEAQISIDGYAGNQVAYHLHLLLDARFVVSGRMPPLDTEVVVDRLTMHGVEYLEHVRDPQIWSQTVTAAEKVGSKSLYVLDRIARRFLDARIERVAQPDASSWTVL